MEGFLHYDYGELILEGLVHGGAYFRNFTVTYCSYKKNVVTLPVSFTVSYTKDEPNFLSKII